MNQRAYNYTVIAFCAVLVFFGACKKTEIREVNEPYLIEGNDPPDYSGVTTLQVQNYVGRVYIDLLGEQPSVEVLQEKVEALQAADLSAEARENFVEELMTDDEYYVNVYNYTSGQFIEGTTRAYIQEQIDTYAYIIELYYDQGEVQLAQYVEYEMQKLQKLLDADTDWAAGTITINEFYGRFCYNALYDEINMGSQNMVISCFENLFGRYPTNVELENGVAIIEGVSAILLQQNGTSKTDFVNIVTHTPEFYLGRVHEQYQRLLTRQPLPIEEQDGSDLIAQQGLKAFQVSVLITDEYAGF